MISLFIPKWEPTNSITVCSAMQVNNQKTTIDRRWQSLRCKDAIRNEYARGTAQLEWCGD